MNVQNFFVFPPKAKMGREDKTFPFYDIPILYVLKLSPLEIKRLADICSLVGDGAWTLVQIWS